MAKVRRVVCTGLGAVSCFGVGIEEFWRGLCSNRSGKGLIGGFDASPYRSNFAAEVPQEVRNSQELQALAGRPAESATLFASIAAHEAFRDAGLHDAVKSDFGCVVGTLSSSAHLFERYGRLFAAANTDLSQYPDVDACTISYQLEHLVRHFQMEGPSTLISTSCSSSTDAIGYAADFIRNGNADVMLAGGGDILSETAHAGFNSVFSITTDDSKSFDTQRSGFFIGEGAGMLVLEELEHALAREAHIYAEVLGYGLSNAAYHLTATSRDGVGEALAIERCLADAGVDAADVQYVNAHGTGTKHNDISEAKALNRVFGESLGGMAITSIKANIGHCMGAAGALEAIATIKCIADRFIPATLNSAGDIDPVVPLVVGNGIERVVRHGLSQSFGFGGASSAVLFGAPDLIASPPQPETV
ncbi:beta-ketoacyl-[acyl-carrier-protein] synthase family protein [Massilia sp. GER05]|uniref:beta-ketoacyl-[acyl-carrier-protein] synthase family protein n=1 Tax=Massilia sp. GER05 TaxID=3394605 RepID=UPI003F872902